MTQRELQTPSHHQSPLTLLFIPPRNNSALWLAPLRAAFPFDDFRVFPDVGDPATIDCALVADPPRGELANFPRLRLIQSLWAGVDALLADPTLPGHIPLARLVDPSLTSAMSESVVAHVLSIHRQLHIYRLQQSMRKWQPLPQPHAHERRVGILGLGALGSAAANKLMVLGFDVAGWSRRPKHIDGMLCFTGQEGLDMLLSRTDILVCLLPLTPETRDILNARTLALLPQGATVINLARGEHISDEDLLDSLNRGHIAYAILDTFSIEPLPTEHPYWSHPHINVTPHVAATTDPRTAIPQVVQNIERLREGLPLIHLVDRVRG
ncbi:MAG: glyoxylate/hydroxypyruvate reductase A, partial [Ktedonobacteraceae bacterium]|nr:glyoxylate/hydroxypyruvate reductase A [Ktedonobacteraceae bacterium]